MPLAAALLVSLAGCERAPEAPQVSVEEVWVQLPVVPGRPGAAYFTLRATGEPPRLIGLSSPAARGIELHQTSSQGGVSRMAPLPSAAFNDIGEIEFRPGGKHAMLSGLDPKLKPGDTVPLTFGFDKAPAVTAQAQVRAFGQGHGAH